MNGYLLDTHIWIWAMAGSSEKVSSGFFTDLEKWQRSESVYLSPITCWELGLLTNASLIELDQPIEALWARDTMPGAFQIADLSAKILIESTQLPGSIHRDPADRILVATARVYGLTLVTRDGKLLDYAKAGHLNGRKP